MLSHFRKSLIVVIIPLLLILAQTLFAAEKTLQSAIDLIDADNYREAYDILHGIEVKTEDPAVKKRVDYLIGHATLRLEMFDKCAEYFNKGVTGYPELADYADYNISRCYAASSRFREATIHLEKFAKRYPDSRLIERATFDLAKYGLLSGRVKKGLKILNHFIKQYPNAENIAEAYFMRGGELERLGKFARAYEDYRTIYYKYPVSPLAEDALKRTIVISKNRKVKIKATGKDLRKGRVDILFKKRQYEAAIKDINERVMPILRKKEKGEMLLLLAKCHVRGGRKGKAIEELRRYVREYPKGEGLAEATYTIGRLYWNMGRTEDALNYMNLTSIKFKGDEYASRAIYVIGRIYTRRGNLEKGIEAYNRLIEGKHQDSLVESAYWRIGWIYYMDGRYKEMVSLLQSAVDRYPDSSLRNNYLYWLGRGYERLRKKDKAISAYSAVSDYPHFYYSSLSRERLKSLGVKIEGKVVTCSNSEADFDSSISEFTKGRGGYEQSHLKKALELAELGFEEDARLELELSQPIFKGDNERMWLMSRFYERIGSHNKAILIRNNILLSMGKYAESISIDKVRRLYPLSYWEDIVKYSQKNKVDPFISISIVRQESKFDYDALSAVNARGLMQLIPSTAERMYRKVYGKGFNNELLFDPEINISLGTRYFSLLVKRFDGNVVAAIASYNAGPIPVRRWIKEYKGIPMEEFVENVPYSQTKGYLKKVLGNYYNYKRLYPKESGCENDNI